MPAWSDSAAFRCINYCNQILTYSTRFLLCTLLHSATQYIHTYGAYKRTHTALTQYTAEITLKQEDELTRTADRSHPS